MHEQPSILKFDLEVNRITKLGKIHEKSLLSITCKTKFENVNCRLNTQETSKNPFTHM